MVELMLFFLFSLREVQKRQMLVYRSRPYACGATSNLWARVCMCEEFISASVTQMSLKWLSISRFSPKQIVFSHKIKMFILCLLLDNISDMFV